MANVVSARHSDFVAGAPFAYFGSPPKGVPQFSRIAGNFIPTRDGSDSFSAAPFFFISPGATGYVQAAPQLPAVGVQHASPDAPVVTFKGTPPFVPPNARNNSYWTFPPQHASPDAPVVTFKGTPPFVPPNPRNIGFFASGIQQPDAIGPSSTPWSMTGGVVPQVQIAPHSRGSRAFASSGSEFDWSAPYTFTRATFAIPVQPLLQAPQARTMWEKAKGWWDILSDAPFFFGAGFATAPPGPPPMRATGEQLPYGDAAWQWTRNTPVVNPNQIPLRGSAFGLQMPDASAPEVGVLGVGAVPPGPPVTNSSFALQLPADIAPFAWTLSRPKATAIRPLIGAFGQIQPADSAAFVWTVSRSPLIVISPPEFTGKAFAYQHPADAAPYSFTPSFLPTISIVPTIPPSVASKVFVWQQWSADAPYVFFDLGVANNINPATQIPSGRAFGYQYSDDIAPFLWAKSLPLVTTIPPVTAELLSAAIYRIVNANLLVYPTFIYQPSATIPTGYVINTIPPTGTVLPIWSQVEIIVSSGPSFTPGKVTVPNLIGDTAQSARDQLFAIGLSLDTYLWQINNATAGTVINQSILAGTVVTVGTLVQLTLSLGPVKPPVPTPPIPPPNSS